MIKIPVVSIKNKKRIETLTHSVRRIESPFRYSWQHYHFSYVQIMKHYSSYVLNVPLPIVKLSSKKEDLTRCGFGTKHRSVYLRRMSPLDHCTVTYSLKNCCYQAHFMAVMRDKLPYFHLTLIGNLYSHSGLFPFRLPTLSWVDCLSIPDQLSKKSS